jgi:hypothetical protein
MRIMKNRVCLALSFAVGLALAGAGCGPTASEPETSAPAADAAPGEMKTDSAAPTGLGGGKPGEGGMMGGAEVPAGNSKDGATETPADPKTAAAALSTEEIATINEMPDQSDAKLALAQMVCPVGEDEEGKPNHLGSMGKPIKEVVDGKTVFLCCKGCVEDFKADAKKYLSKLGK